MKLTDFDLETAFQTALAQFDSQPGIKRALIGLYRSYAKLLIELVRQDARKRRIRK